MKKLIIWWLFGSDVPDWLEISKKYSESLKYQKKLLDEMSSLLDRYIADMETTKEISERCSRLLKVCRENGYDVSKIL